MLRRDDDSVLRVALELEVSGKRKLRMTKKNLEGASGGGGDRANWFEEGGYPESSKAERRSARNCRRNGVYSAISTKGTTPDNN